MTLVNTDRADKVRKIAELAIRAMGAEHPDGKCVSMSTSGNVQGIDVTVYDRNPESGKLKQAYSDYDYLDLDRGRLDSMIAVLENFLKECGV